MDEDFRKFEGGALGQLRGHLRCFLVHICKGDDRLNGFNKIGDMI